LIPQSHLIPARLASALTAPIIKTGQSCADAISSGALFSHAQSGFSVWPLLSGFSYAPCSMVWAMPLAAMMGRLRIDIKEGLA
jgi:hypothetical protein